tara:strand:- start:241 stop:597 length:357 start_codon:yes stop_codon:yes gene_type:complete
MDIRLKIGNSEYLIAGDNKKVIEFAGMFFDHDIVIKKLNGNYINVDHYNVDQLDAKDIKEIKDFCSANHIDDFQFYEDIESVNISMSDDRLKTITPVQQNLEKLIKKLSNKPKLVPSA